MRRINLINRVNAGHVARNLSSLGELYDCYKNSPPAKHR